MLLLPLRKITLKWHWKIWESTKTQRMLAALKWRDWSDQSYKFHRSQLYKATSLTHLPVKKRMLPYISGALRLIAKGVHWPVRVKLVILYNILRRLNVLIPYLFSTVQLNYEGERNWKTNRNPAFGKATKLFESSREKKTWTKYSFSYDSWKQNNGDVRVLTRDLSILF